MMLGFGVLLVFPRPVSPEAYERTAEDELFRIAEGLDVISQTVADLHGARSRRTVGVSMTYEEHARFEGRINEGAASVRHGAETLRSIRVPSEYRTTHYHVLGYTDYLVDVFLPEMQGLADEIEPGIDWNQLNDMFDIIEPSLTRGATVALEHLEHIAPDIYVPQSLLEAHEDLIRR